MPFLHRINRFSRVLVKIALQRKYNYGRIPTHLRARVCKTSLAYLAVLHLFLLQNAQVMKNISFKKIIFSLFSITETTDRGKKWKRIAAEKDARWLKIVKMSEYRVEVA